MLAAAVDLTSSHPGLYWSAISCTAASVLCFWGAMRGIIRHRFPRILVAVATSVIALSYWVESADLDGAVDMRRGAGWLLWPALAWTSWTGVKYSRKVVAESRAIRERFDDDSG